MHDEGVMAEEERAVNAAVLRPKLVIYRGWCVVDAV